MGKAIHLVCIDAFPLTTCGVNIEEKTGADWILNDGEEDISQVTCFNCLKSRKKGIPDKRNTSVRESGVDVDYPTPPVSFVDPQQERIDMMYRLRDKITTISMDIRYLHVERTNEEEGQELDKVIQWLEGAREFLGYAITAARPHKKEKES